MITGFFLKIFYTLILFFVDLLPVIAFPSQISSAFTTITGYVNSMSFLLPIGTLITVLSYALVFHVSILLWRLANLVASYIRGR